MKGLRKLQDAGLPGGGDLLRGHTAHFLPKHDAYAGLPNSDLEEFLGQLFDIAKVTAEHFEATKKVRKAPGGLTLVIGPAGSGQTRLAGMCDYC